MGSKDKQREKNMVDLAKQFGQKIIKEAKILKSVVLPEEFDALVDLGDDNSSAVRLPCTENGPGCQSNFLTF